MKTIITKYLKGEASRTEQKKLLRFLLNKKNRVIFNKEKTDWKKELRNTITSADTTEELMHLQCNILKSTLKKQKQTKLVRTTYGYTAAALFLGFLIISFLYFNKTEQTVLYTKVIAEKGQITKVMLADSSEVWLNSESVLTYNSNYGIDNRNLKLSGQGYFSITHNENLPASINSRDIKVNVLGTKFMVNAYESTDKCAIVLKSGLVRITMDNMVGKEFLLKPNERFIYNAKTKYYKKDIVNASSLINWHTGILTFNNCTLLEICKDLESKYGCVITVDDRIKNSHITLTITNESLNEVLQILSKITGAKIKNQKGIINIK